MSDAPVPAAASYTAIHPPSGGPSKSSSIKEGFICAGIYAVMAVVMSSGFRNWGEHPKIQVTEVMPAEHSGHFIGYAVGQIILMGLVLSYIIFCRRRKNVTHFILLDWRWLVVCLVLYLLPWKPIMPWLWVGLIYQWRLSIQPKFPPSSANAA
jgi:hypothetical protein